MILEVADFTIDPAQQDDFEKAVKQGVSEVISKAKGFISYRLHRGIENPGRYVLLIQWQTLENHTIDFRQSEDFPKWRSFVGPYFVNPPVVEHFNLANQS